jgi:homoserine kinase
MPCCPHRWKLAHSTRYALAGESVASGSAHGDNVGPQLLGGLVLATLDRLIAIPIPDNLWAAVSSIPTMSSKPGQPGKAWPNPFPIHTIVAQNAHLAVFLSGCYQNNLDLVRAGLKDILVEPRRAQLIPGFAGVKQAALDHGALGASISGAGPSVFGWFTSPDQARSAAQAMIEAFANSGLEAQSWVSPVAAPGARLIQAAP